MRSASKGGLVAGRGTSCRGEMAAEGAEGGGGGEEEEEEEEEEDGFSQGIEEGNEV